MRRASWFNITSLTLGFAFLYLPMILLVIYSFNSSKLVTVWAGFSTKWYGELLQNEAFLNAAMVTLKVAVASSTLATVLGTMAAYILVRGGRFAGRTLFSGMIYAPLVMPEVITGLSLLLLFIGIGLDRGTLTIVLAHTTFSMCYVSVVAPEINALSTIMIGIVTCGVITASLISKRKAIKAQRDVQAAERAAA